MRFAEANGVTQVSVVGEGQVSGIVARVGQRLLGGTAKMLMNRFFSCIGAKT